MTHHDKTILKVWITLWIFIATLMLPTDMMLGLLTVLILFSLGGQIGKVTGFKFQSSVGSTPT